MDENEIKSRPRRRSPAQTNRRLQAQYLSWLLIGTVLILSILGIVNKDKVFSESENRNLAQFPQLTYESVCDGSFLNGVRDYVADQFPGRDMWVSLNLLLNKTLGWKESSNVYLCEDDYLMQIPAEPDREQLEKNLNAINGFGKKYSDLNTVVSVVPNAVFVHSDKLPENAPMRSQEQDIENLKKQVTDVTFLDVSECLQSHNDQQLYYRTDHHWTSLGAYYAFTQIGKGLNIPVPDLDSYIRYTVSETFEGTLSSKSGSHEALDTVEIFVPQTDIDYFVTYGDDHTGICSLYNRDALNTKDHYTVFFGGNYGRVDITTTADTGRVLLLFKDSYANCFVQFLYPYFDHITMVDPRYYYDNIANVIRSEGVTDVLFLYNLDTFLSDRTLADVLNG